VLNISHNIGKQQNKNKNMDTKALLQNKSKNGKPSTRGRKRIPIELPKSTKFTISAILAANPQIKCRPTVYSRVNEMVKGGLLKRTSDTEETGKVGKPGFFYWKMGAWKSFQALKASNKTKGKKLATVPAVDLTPVEAPAETVTA